MRRNYSIWIAIALSVGCCRTAQRNPGVYAFCRDESFVLPKSLMLTVEDTNVLVLSGGGSSGAWGAGVLNAWDEHSSPPRPKVFKVVTGISAGSLMATQAFLDRPTSGGKPSDREELRRDFTEHDSADIYHWRWPIEWPFVSSLTNTAPLERLIATIIDTSTVQAVAAAHYDGRRLFIGTVDLDTNTFCTWDMGALAMSTAFDDKSKLALYRRILLASASIPVFFNPVDIGGQLHVDGGTRANFFLRDRMLDDLAGGKKAQLRGNVFMLMNGRVKHSDPSAPVTTQPVAPRLVPVALRSLQNLMDSNSRGQLVEAESIADRHGLRIWASYIPDASSFDSPVQEFVPEKMAALFEEAGKATTRPVGRDSAWHELPSITLGAAATQAVNADDSQR